jgi:hypothetical protein
VVGGIEMCGTAGDVVAVVVGWEGAAVATTATEPTATAATSPATTLLGRDRRCERTRGSPVGEVEDVGGAATDAAATIPTA